MPTSSGITFQFHYGSIKSEQFQEGMTLENQFQFHYGSIKSGTPLIPKTDNLLVSIPLWFD